MRLSVRRKTALVTGGTDGVGREAALGLARAGCAVILVGRNAEKGARVKKEIRAAASHDDVSFFRADLSLMREAERLAGDVARRWPALNYLVLSAGIVRPRLVLTDEGVESNFAVNYLSRFELIRRLLPFLQVAGRPSAASRIVLIGGGARNGTIHFDDVDLTSSFTMLRAIWQFQQAKDVLAAELARRLTAADAHTTISCLKLGPVKTGIRREFPLWARLVVKLIFDPLLTQTAAEAGAVALKLLMAEEYEGANGALFLKIRRLKRIVSPSADGTDPPDRPAAVGSERAAHGPRSRPG